MDAGHDAAKTLKNQAEVWHKIAGCSHFRRDLDRVNEPHGQSFFIK
jgi:hypothetical protein